MQAFLLSCNAVCGSGHVWIKKYRDCLGGSEGKAAGLQIGNWGSTSCSEISDRVASYGAYWGNPCFCISGNVSGAPGARNSNRLLGYWEGKQQSSKLYQYTPVWQSGFVMLKLLLAVGSALWVSHLALAKGWGSLTPCPVTAREPAWLCPATHSLGTATSGLVSPEYPEDRRFHIVMVLWCCHFWDSDPEEQYLMSGAWSENLSNGKQLEVNIKDSLFEIYFIKSWDWNADNRVLKLKETGEQRWKENSSWALDTFCFAKELIIIPPCFGGPGVPLTHLPKNQPALDTWLSLTS